MKSLLPVINHGLPTNLVQPFHRRVTADGMSMMRASVNQLQINLGKLCNQTCTHCHVDAGPTKTRENMDRKTADRIVELSRDMQGLSVVDLTGGAPEMNPNFRRLVEEFRSRDVRLIDRCNLTILRQPGFEWVGDFLADHRVHVVASLPCYLEDNVDSQRGNGVFRDSIDALQQLNDLGYGKPETGLCLDLVFNPTGPSLPPEQQKLETDYKRELLARYQVQFNHLLTITNIPIRRYAMYLSKRGGLESYMRLLEDSYNPDAAASVMCRSLISISWDGKVYDCDFNQMIDLPAQNGLPSEPPSIWSIESFDEFAGRSIATADHCYGCTAGSGSSCSGALT